MPVDHRVGLIRARQQDVLGQHGKTESAVQAAQHVRARGVQVFHLCIAAQESECERQALFEEIRPAAKFRSHHQSTDFPRVGEQRGIDRDLGMECFGEGELVPHRHEPDGADDLLVLLNERDDA